MPHTVCPLLLLHVQVKVAITVSHFEINIHFREGSAPLLTSLQGRNGSPGACTLHDTTLFVSVTPIYR